MRSIQLFLLTLFLSLPVTGTAQQAGQAFPIVTSNQTIQETLDAQPGRMLFLPAGDYEISEKLVIRSDGSGLYGPGRIIQTQSRSPVSRN